VVHSTTLHGASGKEHTNFADESVRLMSNKVWKEGKFLTLWTD
jgi:hypothetical protein